MNVGNGEYVISIIVPVYNVEPYLETCIDSILNQTYSKLEIILVASTSSDGSVAICDEYSRKDQRIKVIHEDAKGLSAARNRGIEHSSGKYLCFIDSDDYISPEFVESLHSLCLEHGCDIAQCDFMKVEQNENGMIGNGPCDVHLFSGIEMCYNLYNEMAIASVVTWSKMYERHLFDDVRFPEGKLHEDEATTYILFFKAKRVAVIGRTLYYYRQVKGSIMGSKYSLKRLDGVKFYEERLDFFKMKGEPRLYAMTLLALHSLLVFHLRKIRVYLPGSKDVLKELKRKQKSTWGSIMLNRYIPIRSKISITIIVFFDLLIIELRKMVQSSGRVNV